jgi:hypothetical protein
MDKEPTAFQAGSRHYIELMDQLNPIDVPMTETDYFKWLQINGTGHRIEDKKAYLASKGFVKGTHVISASNLQNMKTIESRWAQVKYRGLDPQEEHIEGRAAK